MKERFYEKRDSHIDPHRNFFGTPKRPQFHCFVYQYGCRAWRHVKTTLIVFPRNMGYWSSVRSRWVDIGQALFHVFINLDEVEVNNNANKNEANIQPFCRKNLVHNEFIIWQKIKLFSCGTKEGIPERVANRNRGFVLLCRSPIQPKNEAKYCRRILVVVD